MSTVDRGHPREQTANDAICVYDARRGGVAVCACACVECAGTLSQNITFSQWALPQNKKMSGTSGKIISMK